MATESTDEGKIGQFRRMWGSLQCTKFDADRRGGWYRGGGELAYLAVKQRLESHCIVFLV